MENNKYTCVRCNYTTDKFTDLKRHILKKTSCIKCTDAFSLSEDEILIYSLLPLDINEIKKNNNTEHLQKSKIVNKNKIELFNILSEVDRDKVKKCKYCYVTFNKVCELKKHMIINCFHSHCKKVENNLKISNTNTISNSNSISNSNITLPPTPIKSNDNMDNTNNVDANIIMNSSINSNNNNTNSNNTINIYFDIKPPIPFDDNWDISKINENFISGVLNSKYMYTKLLQEILENEINLNVIIDKESKSGLVYKNDIDKYIRMKSTEIVNNTMEKLKNHLLEMNKNDTTQFDEVIDFSKKMINKKYIDFNRDPLLNKNVNDVVNNVFDNKKDKAIQLFRSITEKDKLNNDTNKTENNDELKGF